MPVRLCAPGFNIKPTLFYSLEIGSGEEDGSEKRLDKEEMTLYSHSWPRKNKTRRQQQQQQQQDRIKILKVIFEESPTVANQLLFYQE